MRNEPEEDNVMIRTARLHREAASPAVRAGVATAAAALAVACMTFAFPAPAADKATDTGQPVEQAMAKMIDGKGNEIGSASLVETAHGVLVSLDMENLPAGTLAFHIHTTGKCDTPDFKSAGGHFNPEDRKHGFLSDHGAHAGDLPNIHVPESGKIQVGHLARGVTLAEDKDNTLFDEDGSALVIHAKADDYRTDPAGDAGDRIACGVVTR